MENPGSLADGSRAAAMGITLHLFCFAAIPSLIKKWKGFLSSTKL
jgi:hypothetical protein